MRYTSLTFLVVLWLAGCVAPGDGRTVILKPDGTWQYADAPAARPAGQVLPAYTKPAAASGMVKGTRVPYELWFDETKWRLDDVLTPPDSDHELHYLGQDARAKVVVERIVLPLDAAVRRIVAVSNRHGMKDVKVIREERRIVNGATMVYLHAEGTDEGIRFVWVEHVYSSRRGTIQLTAFTGQNLFWEYARDFEDLLNGLVVPPE